MVASHAALDDEVGAVDRALPAKLIQP